MRRRLFIILFIIVATAVVGVLAVYIVRPQLIQRIYDRATGKEPVSGLNVKPGRKVFPVKGIDISHHNGLIDFRRVAADSVDFVIIKATEGVNHTDSMMFHNWREARNAGILVGFYHFFRFDRGGVRQGRHFLNAIGDMATDMPLVIDFEVANNPERDYYLVIGRLRDMAGYLRRRGRRVMIYCNHNEYDKYIRGNFDYLDLWLASGRLPAGDDRRHLWQHSHNGRVAGISTPVDINTFNGSREEFIEWINAPAPQYRGPRMPQLPDTVPATFGADTAAVENSAARGAAGAIQ